MNIYIFTYHRISRCCFLTGLGILLIAPWGYPPLWRKSVYRIDDIRIAGRNVSGRCVSCSSTVSLYLVLKSRNDVQNAWLLAIGSDTVKRPISNGSIREDVKRWFEDVKEQLFNSTTCDGIERRDEWVKDIYIGIVPGIGEYYGYIFRGSIKYMFVEAYRIITYYINKLNPDILLLDTTHGLNILTISVLYATIGASIIYDKKIYVFNSEPYPPGTRSPACIQGEKPEQHDRLPILNVHDISTLQWVIEYLRALSFLKYFNEKPLAKILSISKNSKQSRLETIMNNIICMIEALRTGLVGLIFNNSKLSSGTSIPFTIREIVKKLEQLPDPKSGKVWIKPVLKGNTVEYEIEYGTKEKIQGANHRFYDKDFRLEFIPIIDALIKYKEEFKDLAEIDSLKEFGQKVGNLLSKKGYWDKKQIVIHETSDLTEIAKNIQKELGKEKGNKIPGELLREYWKKAKNRDNESVKDLDEEIPSARNFAAHAALNHNIIEIIKLSENGEIIEIIYNSEKLYRILEEKIGRYTSLLKCIPRNTKIKTEKTWIK